ncbi:MAG: DEAD/DEAH box helicase [Treponema succinifaciens]|uniref:DNA repair helicase XPB n=1 Tax=Treponema TaxID=157 RepID=UPI0023F45579|nr:MULTISPECIES: DNA repair helicase XPB [Treponema]MDD6963384.1 DEAD/DEAH box helicase [Treponema succinifaciens]MDY5117001.1 DNA repair helicase XPB [Treponema succinifaciens]
MPESENPLIVQSDRALLLDVHAPLAEECRAALIPFAELVRSPEHLHTYQISSLSLWNAESSGFTGEQAVEVLKKFSRYEIPQSVVVWIEETSGRFGKLRLVQGPSVENSDGIKEEYLYLVSNSPYVFKQIEANAFARKFLVPCECAEEFSAGLSEKEKTFCFKLLLTDRGIIKQNLLKIGWPVKDDVPLQDGFPLEINLRKTTFSGRSFEVREYQKAAANALVGNKGPGTGFGTIVLPCGAGKTIVGMEIMSLLKTNTLIVTTNITAVHQWIDELIDKTDLDASQIAEYTGENKTIKPVTVATYQILTWRPDKNGPYPHFSLFRQNNWGLVIYDEVHMIPAPVFRVAAELQAVRRVGLTATLVREDGCEGNVFSLVGPKRYDVPWKELEKAKWIAKAECIEVRLGLPENKEIEYAVAANREKHRIASENPLKNKIVQELVEKFKDDKILIIGQFLTHLEIIAKLLNVPIITGKTKNSERDIIYDDFRSGKIRVLVVSKVANFAIDLPDASVAIQVSGTFGSRQEEAQRLGRILRPKERTSRFFTLITRGTVEEDFGSNRQKFLAEQGYSYRIVRYENEKSFDDLEVPIQIEGCGQ